MFNNKDKIRNDKSHARNDAMLLFLHDHRKSVFYKKFVTSVMAAFLIGLIVGVICTNSILPAIGLHISPTETQISFQSKPNSENQKDDLQDKPADLAFINEKIDVANESDLDRKKIVFPTNKKLNWPPEYSSVSFLKAHDKNNKRISSHSQNSRKKFKTKALSPNTQNVLSPNILKNLEKADEDESLNQRYKVESASVMQQNDDVLRQIVTGIYWGPTIEKLLPVGSSRKILQDWKAYIESNTTKIIKVENGCGRMQNRLVTFNGGVQACVRYRINNDQIQGELFSFLLGQLLNLTNLVPSCAAIVNWSESLWFDSREYMEDTQWKNSKPVVLTKFIADLEPSEIPSVFRPIDRHLNIDDVRSFLIADNNQKPSQVLIDRLKSNGGTYSSESLQHAWNSRSADLSEKKLEMFVELAQWSDLIVFDYLIANLDRVVNNLYNYQWNHEILAAPAHNLAKQRGSKLLVFLDNESGLLHGYRLLNKYEVYHNLLLDNLCIFRKPTIDALKALHDQHPGKILHELFRIETSNAIRHEIPPLPEKSIKILSSRIERILQQVRKCQE